MAEKAENWQEMAAAVKQISEAWDKLPAPPQPDDHYAMAANGARGHFEQMKNAVYQKANNELAAEEDE